ncbi:hypothetical protein MKW98_004040, partial [Papaver atlanticum]
MDLVKFYTTEEHHRRSHHKAKRTMGRRNVPRHKAEMPELSKWCSFSVLCFYATAVDQAMETAGYQMLL